MDFEKLIPLGVALLAGTLSTGSLILGWFLNSHTTRTQLESARRQRIDDQRIEAYATYLSLMTRFLYGTGDEKSGRELQLARTKLLLLEQDEALVKLIGVLDESIPEHHTNIEFEEASQFPDFEWKPFDDAAEALRVGVRRSLNARR